MLAVAFLRAVMGLVHPLHTPEQLWGDQSLVAALVLHTAVADHEMM